MIESAQWADSMKKVTLIPPRLVIGCLQHMEDDQDYPHNNGGAQGDEALIQSLLQDY